MKALITGSSSGIGAIFAKMLDDMGYETILVARREKRLQELSKSFKNKCEIIKCDLSKMDEVEKLYHRIQDEDVNIFINNAGFGLFGEFYKTDIDKELEMIDVNIKALHYLSKMYLKDNRDKKNRYLLNVASSAGFMAGPKLSTYYATKNYVLKLTEAIYEEEKLNGGLVSISALCPGPVDTEFNDVAKGVFHTAALTPEYVARYALKKMFKHQLVIIPSMKMKLIIFFQRFVPLKILLRMTYSVQDRKMK